MTMIKVYPHMTLPGMLPYRDVNKIKFLRPRPRLGASQSNKTKTKTWKLYLQHQNQNNMTKTTGSKQVRLADLTFM